MRLLVIFSILCISFSAYSQKVFCEKPDSVFQNAIFSYDNFEEGSIYTWHSKDSSFIMMAVGSLCDLEFPVRYSISSEVDSCDVKIISAIDPLNNLFGRKVILRKSHIIVQYCNFHNTNSIDSLSRLLQLAIFR